MRYSWVLVVVAFLLLPANLFAMLHPVHGRFMQRDPGVGDALSGIKHRATFLVNTWGNHGNPYLDGLDLYQIEKGQPVSRTDHSGTVSGSEAMKNQVCGPDVTDQVKRVLLEIKVVWNTKWTEGQKRAACAGLHDPFAIDHETNQLALANAWDIAELRLTEWINARPYYPTCATPQSMCKDSVAINGKCWQAGSVNYLAYGVMCKLCNDAFWRPQTSETGMLATIDWWKGPLALSGDTQENWFASMAWAVAGYRGWPSYRDPSPPDRSECACPCTVSCQKKRFSYYWYPHGTNGRTPYSGYGK